MYLFTVLITPGFLALFGLSIVYYFISVIRSYRRLCHVPGPQLWGWSVLPLFRIHITGKIDRKLEKLSEMYGPLVRIGPNLLLASDPEVLRRMTQPRSPYTRSNWYVATRLTPGIDNVLSTRDEKHHNELRKRMAAGYAGKENYSLESDIDECILDLMRLIDTKYISTKEIPVKMELARKIQFLTSDIMSKLSFDSKFNDLRDDHDNYGYIHEIETLYPNIFCTSVLPELVEFLTKTGVLQLLTPTENSKLGLGKIQAITKAQVASRFEADGIPKANQYDMLGSFVRHGLTREELEQESMLQLAAGSDTSATAIRGTMLCLMRNQKAYRKLMEEIDTAIKNQKIPNNFGQVISDNEAKSLPYLQAVIKEGMRWFPPIAGLLAKEVPPGGDTLNGYFIPEGTAIGYSANAVHHSPLLFGPDEQAFRPERWIHTSEGGDEPSFDKIKEMERNNELLFGYGKYQCLGKSVAFIELNKIFVELLRRFEFTLLDPENPWQTRCFGIHFQEGLWVTVKRREEAKA